MEILRVENLTKVYGKGENEVRALDGVSFSVEKGEFVAVIGRPAPANPPCFTFSAAWTGLQAAGCLWTARMCTRRTRNSLPSSAAVRWD